MSDAIKAAVKNTSQFAIPGVGLVDNGTVMTMRWTDVFEPPKKEELQEDGRSAQEITADIWERIRGERA